ncbi:MAG: enoyl-CoA hydratase/isomerase family protein [Gammaproteobacteria bacterium]|jgi:enoyl-CoA hydratase/carnithine racemase|nr:enoyl-CoA hydratase/isomerase family protein [Gammaproteobacteria bacterium]MBT3868420.1 enoyl-CoA hydratase/isomerase family protein [Gammaproteobacteria bacterium]MBT4377180.1 enoyl-CoA hydratase/isomerase family protein [Gammaproteobacteria bacterium]MBT4616496.1 enoyl-CoA hydratase/isomerase family protein [Gammaproteobacteria bacterium]MBT5199817.1 enoyl-CoA hydratase/isomerase family protein [Gammaproteobacteria bacterium]
MKDLYGDVAVTRLDGHVVQCEIKRPPNNFFDHQLIKDLATCFEDIDKQNDIRAIVLCSEGKHFCAGANFGSSVRAAELEQRTESDRNPLYDEAVRLFRCNKPVIAAVQGAAVGGGFGLALMADFRVVCPATRMTANFVKLGFTPGFGLTHTLERIVGAQRANLMFLTGRRINGETAQQWGLGDIYTDTDNVRSAAIELAQEIAENAPLALLSLREQMRPNIAEAVNDVTTIESREQKWLQQTSDHKEGIKAVAEKRAGNFTSS